MVECLIGLWQDEKTNELFHCLMQPNFIQVFFFLFFGDCISWAYTVNDPLKPKSIPTFFICSSLVLLSILCSLCGPIELHSLKYPLWYVLHYSVTSYPHPYVNPLTSFKTNYFSIFSTINLQKICKFHALITTVLPLLYSIQIQISMHTEFNLCICKSVFLLFNFVI